MKDELVKRIVELDRKFIEDKVLNPELSAEEQRQRVRELLPPKELARYDAGMQLVTLLKDVDVEPNREVNFDDAKNMPAGKGEILKQWLQKNADKVRVYGSFVDWIYTKGYEPIQPSDIDVAVENMRREGPKLAKLLGGKYVEKRPGESASIEVDGKEVVGLHEMYYYLHGMPYDWEAQPAKTIDGIPMERLGEQLMRRTVSLLTPGVGIDGRNMVGPEASRHFQRVKDLPKIKSIIARLSAETFEPAVPILRDTFLGGPHRTYPKVFDEEEAKELGENDDYYFIRPKKPKPKRHRVVATPGVVSIRTAADRFLFRKI
jgi:predicted nucleotidyltransferase